MKLTYVGRHDAVDVPLPDGREPTVENGGQFDFPADIAEQLLAQGDEWEQADSTSKKKAAGKADDSAAAPAAEENE